jgi:putative drug exporter of the RND superfamily
MGLHRITDFSSSRRGKWITLLIWIVLAGLIVPLTPRLAEVRSGEGSLFLPADAESAVAAELVRERFPDSGTPAIIVLRNEDGLTEADFEAARNINDFLLSEEAGEEVNGVISIFTVPQAESDLLSDDNTTMTIIANVTGDVAEQPFTDAINRIRDVTSQYDGAELSVKVSGPAGLVVDLVAVFEGIDGFLLIVTATLVLVLLVVIYRSPIVALVPLVSVGWVFVMADSTAAWLATQIGFAVDGQSTGIMTVLLFGAGTDYCLFISSRYREEMAKVQDKHEAMRRSMRGVGGAIVSAGGTILIATIILLLAVLPAYRSLGPVLAIAVALMMAAALTLVPAILTILGRWSFWPFRPRYAPDQPDEEKGASPIWSRIADGVLRRPVTVLSVTVLALLLMSAGIIQLNPTYDTLESLPADTESVQGFELLREGFPAGELAPTDVFVTLPEAQSVFDPAVLEALDAVTLEMSEQAGVALVSGPSRPFGVRAPVGPDEVQNALDVVPPEMIDEMGGAAGDAPQGAGEIDPDSPTGEAFGIVAAASQFVSPDQSVARIEVVLSDNPFSSAALDMVPDLRETARSSAENAGLSRESVLVGGATAEGFDTREGNNRDTLVVLPLVLLAIAIILGLLLRSLIAPLYLSFTIIISYFATLGLAVLCFKYIFGQDVISSSVPFYLFVFLNALGVDYNIYLMARIREEAKQFELGEATRRALSRTGGVITSAGLILAGTFSALMTLPLQDLFQLGFAVAIGVLMDTFITRTLMVPSIVTLLGRWNWWPSMAFKESRVASRENVVVGDD